jgi:hypothetical protein
MPTALSITTIPFYALALASVFLLGRAHARVTLFERVALIALLVLGIEASRGVTWFVLFATATLPTMLNGLSRFDMRISRTIGVVVLAASMLAALVAVGIVATKPRAWFTSRYPVVAARTVATTAKGQTKVFSNGAYSDWLLLVQPSLRGRIAYDARFELLPAGRLADAAAVSIGRSDWHRILAPFDVIVLRPEETEMRDALMRDGRWRRVPTSSKVVVFRRIA